MSLKLKTVKKTKNFSEKAIFLLCGNSFNTYVSIFSIVSTEEPKNQAE